jgi:hypothetical protein
MLTGIAAVVAFTLGIVWGAFFVMTIICYNQSEYMAGALQALATTVVAAMWLAVVRRAIGLASRS